MNLEIERRYLVNKSKFIYPQKKKEIKQAYIFIEEKQVLRVRMIDDRSFLTYKFNKSGIERLEFEYQIPNKDARKLISLSENYRIHKTRYYLPINNHIWEIDEFHGYNDGLLIAEIELSDKNEAIEIPDWVGDEISTEKKYFNFSLSIKPFKMWETTK